MSVRQHPTTGTGADRNWARLGRVTGITGLVMVFLILGPVIAGSGQEPDFNGAPDQVVRFFGSATTTLGDIGEFLGTVGLLAMVWFVVGIALLLSRYEGEPPWRSAIAAASGLVFVPLILVGSWDAATHRAPPLDPNVATYAFDLGNVTFANGWVALGSFALCCGWVSIGTAALPQWSGWLAVLAGVGLVLGRAVWTTPAWFFPYAMFWIWVLAVCVVLLRRADPVSPS